MQVLLQRCWEQTSGRSSVGQKVKLWRSGISLQLLMLISGIDTARAYCADRHGDIATMIAISLLTRRRRRRHDARERPSFPMSPLDQNPCPSGISSRTLLGRPQPSDRRRFSRPTAAAPGHGPGSRPRPSVDPFPPRAARQRRDATWAKGKSKKKSSMKIRAISRGQGPGDDTIF